MDELELKYIIEALLMSSSEPLTISRMQAAFPNEAMPTGPDIQSALSALAADYATRAVELASLASGYCFQTKQAYAPWVTQLFLERPVKYSSALLEVLAIIAYKQPVTRAEIEEIRGVAVSTTMLKTVLEREWIRVVGHRDVPGKPAVYATTKTFLDYFNLASLDDLPALDVVMDEQ